MVRDFKNGSLEREIVVSVYSTVRARDADGYPYNHVVLLLSDVLEKIRSGSQSLDEWTRMCQVLNVTDRPAYKKYKASRMPAFQPAGVFKQVGKGRVVSINRWSNIPNSYSSILTVALRMRRIT